MGRLCIFAVIAVFIANRDRSKVALMCGGGSGHEPAHAAFVGELLPVCLPPLIFR